MAMLSSKPGERHRVLSYISHALRDVKEKDPTKDVPLTWEYGVASRHASTKQHDTDAVDLFIERCEDYKATVIRVPSEHELSEALAAEVQRLGLQSFVVPPGMNPAWLDAFAGSGLQIVLDSPPLSKKQLDAVEGVLTASTLGIAETGTIALDHNAQQGRRIITLLPPVHLCVVFAHDIVGSVPEAVQLLKPVFASGDPVTWISGPSATVDIEFTRVEGVHGPHKLSIFVVDHR